jgi:hypothetical protein
VDHRAVLHVGVRPDPDEVTSPPDARLERDARALTELSVTDHVGGVGDEDEGTAVDTRQLSLEGTDHRSSKRGGETHEW